jgi:hypothetical protein
VEVSESVRACRRPGGAGGSVGGGGEGDGGGGGGDGGGEGGGGNGGDGGGAGGQLTKEPVAGSLQTVAMRALLPA